MPSEHAKLSPSSAERWLSCPASIRAAEQVPKEPESVYAAEGTAAHTLAEIRSRAEFSGLDPFESDHVAAGVKFLCRENGWDFDEMEAHVAAHIALIRERLALYPGSHVVFEQRLDTGVPRCWGTSDVVIFSDSHVEIIDFKYGSGVAVEAEGNPQLRLYALGALAAFGELLGDVELVRITVHQPRMDHTLTEEITPEDLLAWRDRDVIPVAEIALSDDAYFGPSDEACRWCPVSGRCRAQLEAVFETDFEVKPDTLTPEEVAEIMPQTKAIQQWLNAFDEAALNMAYSEGKVIPGYKVVLSNGRRVFNDPERAIDALVAEGYDVNDVSARSLRSLKHLEALLGSEFTPILGDHISNSQGKPSLVLESDRRKSVSPNSEAKKEFGSA